MNLTIVLVLLALVAVAFAQDPPCVFDMSGKKCDAQEDFPNCNLPSLSRTTCVCPPGTQCKLQGDDGACVYSCEPLGEQPKDNNAGMGPGAGMV
ncbi:uncharacterized protein LOC124135217 isoform X2 [Haliotis rufescens]|uniref:uncharacterized protein LOC124135217 isoform X2 n=1 Tax=Haliotis rufescens TaxID=6454 RepID=UPI00201E85B6|nr:uncharacterized protein LOC124135217 isoform X2 [Haliotis rufescens]